MLGLGLYTSQVTCPASTFFMLSFYVLIWSAATCPSIQTSWHFWTSSCLFRLTVVDLGGDPLILLSFLGSLFSPGPLCNGTLSSRYMKSPKSAYPELWSCTLPSFNPFIILNSPIMVTAAKAAFCLHRVFLFLWVWAEHLSLLLFSVTWNKKLSLMFSKIFLHCVYPKGVEASPKSSRTINVKLLQALSRKLD